MGLIRRLLERKRPKTTTVDVRAVVIPDEEDVEEMWCGHLVFGEVAVSKGEHGRAMVWRIGLN